jgi:hypothetical protein
LIICKCFGISLRLQQAKKDAKHLFDALPQDQQDEILSHRGSGRPTLKEHSKSSVGAHPESESKISSKAGIDADDEDVGGKVRAFSARFSSHAQFLQADDPSPSKRGKPPNPDRTLKVPYISSSFAKPGV